VTGRYRALGFHFTVRADDPFVAAYLGELLDALTVSPGDGPAPESFRVTTADPEGDSRRYDVHLDDVPVIRGATLPQIVDGIVQRLNMRCIASPHWLCTHASSVSHDGEAIVFAAHSESGKSTLAAGLVRAGFAYVSDEAVAFDWESGCIDPYPKPVSLDEGSWSLFPELDPRPSIGDSAEFHQWHVPAGSIGPGRVSSGCRARWLVFPKYDAGAETEVTPITRGEALVEWSKNTFRFNEQGREALTLLAGLVPEVECYRMTVGDLDDAIACVTELVGA
jgi:hypothetical protein